MIRSGIRTEPAKPRFTDALEELVFEVFRVNGLLLAAADDLTHDLGLSSARWQILGALDAAGHPLTVSQIARNMGLTRQAVQRVADDLVRDGYARYAPNADHLRAKLLKTTNKGRDSFAAAMRLQARWRKEILTDAGFNERTLRQLTMRLNALRQALERHAEDTKETSK